MSSLSRNGFIMLHKFCNGAVHLKHMTEQHNNCLFFSNYEIEMHKCLYDIDWVPIHFLFADDCALAAHCENRHARACWLFRHCCKDGLKVRIKKTEVLRQLAQNISRPSPNISIDGNPLKYVKTFNYLCNCINYTANLDDKILCRSSRASQASQLEPGLMCTKLLCWLPCSMAARHGPATGII